MSSSYWIAGYANGLIEKVDDKPLERESLISRTTVLLWGECHLLSPLHNGLKFITNVHPSHEHHCLLEHYFCKSGSPKYYQGLINELTHLTVFSSVKRASFFNRDLWERANIIISLDEIIFISALPSSFYLASPLPN